MPSQLALYTMVAGKDKAKSVDWSRALRAGAHFDKVRPCEPCARGGPPSQLPDAQESFPEFPTVLYWLRQVIGIVLGVVWGVIPMSGAAGIMSCVAAARAAPPLQRPRPSFVSPSFALVSSAIVFAYYTRFVDADEEDFGRYELISEGFMPSFGLFLVRLWPLPPRPRRAMTTTPRAVSTDQTAWITVYTTLHT